MHYCFVSVGNWEQNASFVRLREFGRELVKRGVRVTYFVDEFEWNRKNVNLPPESETIWVPAGPFMKSSLLRRRLIRELNADFVHIINPYVKAYLGLAGTKQKIVGDWDEWPMKRPLKPLHKLRERYLDHWLRGRADRIVVCSRYMQREFKQLEIDAAYIPYATYMQTFADGESPYDNEKAIVYMGNFMPLYDHDLLFDAAVLLKQRGLAPRIDFLGDGGDIERWRAFVRDNNLTNVNLPGYVRGDDLWRRLRHAHALAFPIRATLPNLSRCPSKTFSYAQARRPIIANKVGEVAEVLGDKATYVEPTPIAFADAIEQVLRQSPQEVDYGVERHTWAARTDALLDALEHNAPRGAGGRR